MQNRWQQMNTVCRIFLSAFGYFLICYRHNDMIASKYDVFLMQKSMQRSAGTYSSLIDILLFWTWSFRKLSADARQTTRWLLPMTAPCIPGVRVCFFCPNRYSFNSHFSRRSYPISIGTSKFQCFQVLCEPVTRMCLISESFLCIISEIDIQQLLALISSYPDKS